MFYPGVFINMFDSRGFLFPHSVSLYIDKCITRSKILVVVISNRRNLLLSLCISRYAYRNHKILNILFKILFQIIPFNFFFIRRKLHLYTYFSSERHKLFCTHTFACTCSYHQNIHHKLFAPRGGFTSDYNL